MEASSPLSRLHPAQPLSLPLLVFPQVSPHLGPADPAAASAAGARQVGGILHHSRRRRGRKRLRKKETPRIVCTSMFNRFVVCGINPIALPYPLSGRCTQSAAAPYAGSKGRGRTGVAASRGGGRPVAPGASRRQHADPGRRGGAGRSEGLPGGAVVADPRAAPGAGAGSRRRFRR